MTLRKIRSHNEYVHLVRSPWYFSLPNTIILLRTCIYCTVLSVLYSLPTPLLSLTLLISTFIFLFLFFPLSLHLHFTLFYISLSLHKYICILRHLFVFLSFCLLSPLYSSFSFSASYHLSLPLVLLSSITLSLIPLSLYVIPSIFLIIPPSPSIYCWYKSFLCPFSHIK